MKRPCTDTSPPASCAQVAAALEAGGLPWSAETARAKMRPLLMEWDASHPGREVLIPSNSLPSPQTLH